MEKKYLAKIIANDQEGLQMISACSAGAKVKVVDIKYLPSNKVFLLSIERTKVETDQEDKKHHFVEIGLTEEARIKNAQRRFHGRMTETEKEEATKWIAYYRYMVGEYEGETE